MCYSFLLFQYFTLSIIFIKISFILRRYFNIFVKIPVIIYDRDFDKIRISDDVLSDLCRRCYIARNKNELSQLLEKYKTGNLPSKWSVDFIDKYIYPVDNGDPGESTAKYICNIVK